MNAPVFPPNPQAGQRWGSWTWSGSRWTCTRMQGVFINVQTFPASAPYTPTPGLTSLVVETWGGGGGGGPCGEAFQGVGGGGGGGSGGYSRKTLAAALVLGGVNVTVGAGGYGGGLVANDWHAQPGTPTSFGAFCVANGGYGAQGNISNGDFWGQSGNGAPVGIGDFAVPGNPGESGTSQFLDVTTYANAYGGRGGDPPGGSGGGGWSPLTPEGYGNAGQDGAGPGAGGGGAVVNNPPLATGYVGGTGGPGFCMVTEYCWADTGDDGGDCGCGPGQARVAVGWCPPHPEQWDD